MVLMEIKRGDPEVAEARRLAILPFKLIQVSENDNELAEVYVRIKTSTGCPCRRGTYCGGLSSQNGLSDHVEL